MLVLEVQCSDWLPFLFATAYAITVRARCDAFAAYSWLGAQSSQGHACWGVSIAVGLWTMAELVCCQLAFFV